MVTPQEDDMMHIDSCGTDSANPGWAYLDPAVLYRIIDHLQVQDAAAARQACAHWFKAFSKRGSTLALDFPYKSEVVKKVARLSIPIHTVQIACPGKYAPNQPEYIPVWSKALGSLELLGGVTEASICIPFRHKHLSFLVAGLPHLTRLKIRCSGSLAEQMTNNPVRRNPLPGLVAPRPLGNGLCILAQLCDLTHLESDVIAEAEMSKGFMFSSQEAEMSRGFMYTGDISDLAALTNLTSLVLVLRDLDDDDSESDELSAESSGYSSEGGGGCGDSDAEGSQWGGLARSNGGRTGGMSMSYGSNRFSQCDTHFSRAMSFSSAMSAPNLLRLTIYCLAPLSALVKLETLRIEDDSQGLQGSRLSIAMLQPLEELTWLTSLETETETIGGYSTHEHEDDGWKDNEPLEPRGSVRWKHKEDHAPRWRELDSGVAVRWKDEEDEQEPGRVAHWEDEEGERDEHALQWKADEVGGSVRWKDEEEQGSKWRDHDPSGSVRWKDGDDEEEGCKWRDSDPSGSVRWKEEEEEEEQASKLRDNEPSGSVRWKDEVSDSVVRWKDKEEEATEWKKTGAGVGLETVGSYGSRMRPSVLSRWSPEGREAMSRPKGLQGAQGVERGTLSSPRVLQGVEGVEKEPAGELPPDEADDAAPLIHFQRPQEEAGGRGCPSPTQGRKRTQPHSSPLTSRSSMKKMGSGGGLEMEGSFGSPMRPSVLPRWSPEDTPLPVGGVGAAGVAEVVGAAGAAKRRPRSDEPSGMVRWKDDVRESVVRWKDAVPESNVQWKDEGPESVVRCKDEEEQASRWKDEEVVGRNESVRPHWSPEDTPLSVGGEGAAKLRPRMPWGDELKADPTDARSEWSRPITYRHTPTSGGGGAGSLYGTSGVSHSSAAWTNVMNSVDHYVCSLPMLEGLRSLRLGLYLDCSDGDEGLEGVQELVESISVLPLVTNVAVRLITHPPDERQVRLRRLQEIRRARSNCRWRRAASIVTDGVGRLASHSEMGVAPPVHQASYVHFASDSGKPPNVAGEGRAGDGKEVRWADELDGAVTDTPFPLCERQEGKTNLEGELVARLGELRPSFLEPLLLQDRVTASIEIIQSQEMK
eukprot:gene29678-5091_t